MNGEMTKPSNFKRKGRWFGQVVKGTKYVTPRSIQKNVYIFNSLNINKFNVWTSLCRGTRVDLES